MEGNVCAENYTILWKNTLYSKERIFINQSTVLAVKIIELISERMSHIMMRACRWELALIVRAPSVNSSDDSKYKFYEEL